MFYGVILSPKKGGFMKKLFSVMMLAVLTGCAKVSVDNSVVDSLDVKRFLGAWYEVARYDHRFERGLEKTSVIYSLRDDGAIDVLNMGMKGDIMKEAKGKAKLTDTPALLRVSFFGPFYNDYRVMMIDPDYQYALIGGSTDDYLWILSRTPKLSDDVRKHVLNEVQKRRYDTSKLYWVTQ